ncbi:hypothetical protein AALB39_03235 [Lachnospiraceae bacterium 54-53]
MFEDEKAMEARQLERMSRFTSIETGVYMEGELVRFEETMLFNNEIGMMLPAAFQDMEPEEARKKYFSEKRPQIIKTNKDGSINFSFSLVERKIGTEQLNAVIQDFYRVLKRFQPMSVCLEMDTELLDPVPCAWMEFISSALNENLYNVLTIYPIGEKLLMAMFNCPFQKHMDWAYCLSQIRKGIVIYSGEEKVETS